MQWNAYAMERAFVSHALIRESGSLRVIETEMLGGEHAGNMVFISRIPLSLFSTAELPFDSRRTQFPIRLAFAMTINKSQGQNTQPHRIVSYGISIYSWSIICCCFMCYRWCKFEDDCSKY